MLDYFEFEVGESEKHLVQYYHDEGMYTDVIRVDGVIITRSGFIDLKYPDLKNDNEFCFDVGENEVHEVKIKKIHKRGALLRKDSKYIITIDGEEKDVLIG